MRNKQTYVYIHLAVKVNVIYFVQDQINESGISLVNILLKVQS